MSRSCIRYQGAVGCGDRGTGTKERADCHIELTAVLWSVVLLEQFGEPLCFGGGKSFIERRLGMGVEIVLQQNNFLGVEEVDIG